MPAGQGPSVSPCRRCAGTALQLTVIVWLPPLPVRWHIVTLPEHGVAVVPGVLVTTEVRVAVAATVAVRVIVAIWVAVVVATVVAVRVMVAAWVAVPVATTVLVPVETTVAVRVIVTT